MAALCWRCRLVSSPTARRGARQRAGLMHACTSNILDASETLQPRMQRMENLLDADHGIYRGLPEPDYPFYDRTVTVTTCGRICFNRHKINLSIVFAGQNVGIKQVSDRIWLATFMDYDLGYFDDVTCRLEPIANPFGPKVLPMSPV